MTLQFWHIKVISLLLVLTSLFFWHKYEVKTAVNQAVSLQKAQYDKLTETLKLKSLETETKLNRQVLDMEIKKNAQIKDIDRKYRASIDSLRQRKERNAESNSTGNSSNSESTERATGKELYRDDAEFLARFARDTEELKIYLNACYVQYDEIKTKLNEFAK